MAVPKEVEDIGRVSRMFYFSAEIIGLIVMFVLQHSLSMFQVIRLAIEMVAASYLYIKCTDSAGDVIQPRDFEMEQQDCYSTSSLQGEPEQEKQTHIEQIPEKNYCEECKHFQPYRSKHCQQCKKCIAKYDHHCFWIGGCVGELNHSTFWLFLLFQTLFCCEGFINLYNQLPYYGTYDEEKGHDKYSAPYWIILVMCFMSFGFMLFTGVLCVYHAMLIMTGQTTWEHTKRDSITYLNFYPRFYHPFNYGTIRNITLTFCHDGSLQEWKPPRKQDVKPQFNCFDNQYYSCC